MKNVIIIYVKKDLALQNSNFRPLGTNRILTKYVRMKEVLRFRCPSADTPFSIYMVCFLFSISMSEISGMALNILNISLFTYKIRYEMQ